MEKLREIKLQQESILDHNGHIKTGVFEDYFKSFNLLKRKTRFHKLMNKNMLTQWQAIEILHDDIFVIMAVFKFGVMNRTLFFLYDRNTKELHDYSSKSYVKHFSHIAASLTNKDISNRTTNNSSIQITNELNKNRLHLEGYTKNVSFNIDFERVAKPVVVSLPMSEKHTVYTEKDLLVPKGFIVYKNQTYQLNDSHITILDDHRGYYPLSSGYDWFTCMGNINHLNKSSKFGVNLTYFYRNLDANISENGYWLNGLFHQLPEVHFTREKDVWYIKDKHGIVNLTFTLHNKYHEYKNKGLKIDYTLAFGDVKGTIKVSENETITLDNMFSLGEKRLTKIPFKSPYSK